MKKTLSNKNDIEHAYENIFNLIIVSSIFIGLMIGGIIFLIIS